MEIKKRQAELRQWITDVFSCAGVPEEEAATVSDVLMKAERRGIRSHGISRIPIYVERLENGAVNTKAAVTVTRESACTAILDGGHSLGQVAGKEAMRLAIDKAKETGIGLVGMNRSHHYGIAAYYAEMALEHDMIGFSCCNTKAMMAAPGGASRVIGNNPFSFAFPAGERLPVIFDCACSTVAEGKIIVAKNTGQSIPEGWALDEQGQPTTDPAEALKGFILPMGGVKGYGLAVVVELLSGVLTNAATGTHLTSIYADREVPQNCGNFFAAVRIDAFDDIGSFKQRMDQYIDDIKAGKCAEGVSQVYMPGEIELQKEIELGDGDIEIPEEIAAQMKELSDRYGLQW